MVKILCTHNIFIFHNMCENGKLRLVETVPGMGKGR
jgi:hypothetical protein